MISILLRLLYRRLSYLMGFCRDFLPGMQGGNPFFLATHRGTCRHHIPVAQQPLGFGQTVQQSGRSSVIVT
jgi:hypothetical protein